MDSEKQKPIVVMSDEDWEDVVRVLYHYRDVLFANGDMEKYQYIENLVEDIDKLQENVIEFELEGEGDEQLH